MSPQKSPRQWAIRQWQDIKGNFKFWVIIEIFTFFVGGGVNQLVAFFKHQSPAFWGLVVSAFLCSTLPIAIKLFYPFWVRTRKISVPLGVVGLLSWFWFVSTLSYSPQATARALPPPPGSAGEPSSDIEVRQIEIGTGDKSGELLIVGPTERTKPGSFWAANIHYISAVSHDVLNTYTASLIMGLRINAESDRDKMEDQEWDAMLGRVKYGTRTMRVVANSPSFLTWEGPAADRVQLDQLIHYKAAYYFMGVFLYVENKAEHRTGVCVYREGNSPVVHYCHAHNGPVNP